MRDRADESAVLQNGASRHALDNAAGGVKKPLIGDMDDETFVSVLVVHVDSGDFCIVFFYSITYITQNGSRTGLYFLFVADFHLAEGNWQRIISGKTVCKIPERSFGLVKAFRSIDRII